MFIFIKLILLVVLSLISVAFLTLFERKILSYMGFRVGPNKVSFFGILQPIGDAMKLMNKQINFLSNFAPFFYYFTSFFVLVSSLVLWFCFVSEPSPISLSLGVLVFFLSLGFHSFNSILAGWSVFCKYSLIGSLRTVAQLISYEPLLYFCFFIFLFIYFSFDMYMFSCYYVGLLFYFLPWCFFIWMPSYLAELNRTPYDFSEGESELVSGFNTEFGSSGFTLIFLSEYSNILFFSFLSSYLFFYDFFIFFFFFFFFFVIWVRVVFPRYRYDKLMMLSWKFLIPFVTLCFMMMVFFFLLSFIF